MSKHAMHLATLQILALRMDLFLKVV